MSTEIRLQCINGCGAAAVVTIPEETLPDRIELPVNGHTQVCRADGDAWLEWICEDCMSEKRMTDFVRGGI